MNEQTSIFLVKVGKVTKAKYFYSVQDRYCWKYDIFSH